MLCCAFKINLLKCYIEHVTSKPLTMPCVLLVSISFYSSAIILKRPTIFFFISPFFLLFFLLFLPAHPPFVSFSFLSLFLLLTNPSPLHFFPGGQIYTGSTLVDCSLKRPSMGILPALCGLGHDKCYSGDWFTVAVWVSLYKSLDWDVVTVIPSEPCW